MGSQKLPATFPIRSIRLGAESERYEVLGPEQRELSPLSRFTFFVGPNNSGKSKLLRSILQEEAIRFSPNIPGFEQLNALREDLSQKIKDICDRNSLKDADAYLEKLGTFKDLNFTLEGHDEFASFYALVDDISRAPAISSLTRAQAQAVAEEVKTVGQQVRGRMPGGLSSSWRAHRFRRIYFPTLRTLRSLKGLVELTQSDYFPGSICPEIFTGETLFQEVRKMLLGNLAERRRIAEFESFLSKSFFDGKAVALIPKEGQDVLDIKVGREAERPVHGLGDGIQSILTLTFPLFRYQDEPVLAFFEEPEMFLHPGLQRVLISTLATQFPRHQFFLATHSNHFLDLTLDMDEVSIFTVQKVLDDDDSDETHARFVVENVSNSDRRTLQLLGVRNSSVLLTNCTIWVEGITDRRYLAKYLDLFLASPEGHGKTVYVEDLHYSFVEYGGNNITHWSFLDAVDDPINVDRLCARLFLVTDADSAVHNAKAERRKKLEEYLGSRYFCLPCREIENLVSPNILGKIVDSYERRQANLSCEYADYRSKPLGKFLDEKLKNKSQRRGKYCGDSGTVTDKVGFCSKAIALTNSWDDLTEDAKELARAIHRFIAENNAK